MVKKDLFEYLIFRLEKWKKKIGENQVPVFSKLRLQKILFLVCTCMATNEEKKLLSIFDDFYALPYGPVEIEIYEAMKQNKGFRYISFKGNECVYNKLEDSMFDNLPIKERKWIDEAVDKFIAEKRNYLTIPVFDLVDITHKWSVWYVMMEYAKSMGHNMEKMETDDILKSTKYYG